MALRALLPVLHQPRHAAGPNGSVGLGWQMRERPDGTKTIFKDGADAGLLDVHHFHAHDRKRRGDPVEPSRLPIQRMGGQIIGALNQPEGRPFEPPASDDEP